MTLSSATMRTQYSGSGSTGPFSFPYKFFASGDLEVIKTDTAGTDTTLTLTTHYTVTGAGDSAGGSVTLVTALATGETLTIRRVVDVTQETSFRTQGTFSGASHEDALDRLAMIDQQQQDQLDRSLHYAVTVDPADVSTELPRPTASAVLAWNAGGTALENRTIDDGTTFLTANVLDYHTAAAVDHTLAVQAAAQVLQNAGGGRLYFPPGVSYRLLTSGALPAQVFHFQSIDGIEIMGHGAELRVDRDLSAGNLPILFRFTSCTNVRVEGFTGLGNTYVPAGTEYDRGAIYVQLEGACRNVRVAGTLRWFGAGCIVYGTAGLADDLRTKGIELDLDVGHVLYGFNAQHNGDGVRGRVVSNYAYRSFFIYGVKDYDVMVESRNNESGDCLIRGFNGYGCDNIKVQYSNVGSTDCGALGSVPYCVVLGPADSTAARFSNIDVTVHVIATGATGQPASAFVVAKYTGGSPDVTDRGHQLENIRLSGYISGDPAGANPCINWVGTWGTGEFYRNWQWSDLLIQNAGSPYLVMDPLKGRCVLTNVECDEPVYATGSATGHLVWVGCRVDRPSFDNTEATAATYIGCEFREGLAALPMTAKSYVECEVDTASSAIRLTKLASGSRLGFFGATAVAQQTLGAAATDAATTQTLANNVRTALINLGLGTT